MRQQGSDIEMQIMWKRLISVVEEQAITLVKTAFSTAVREAGDLSAGVFDTNGHMLAQAVTGTPGHVNAMAEAVGHFIRDIGDANIFEGDVYITNDPWKGTGHLHDFTVVTPAFRNHELIGYFACTAHVVDIGGRGFGPDANDVYEEGLFVPIMKFMNRGEVNQTLLSIVKNNVREAAQVVGDLYSLAACNETGQRRLMEMMDEYDLCDLKNLRDFIFDRSSAASMARLDELPTGSYANELIADGYGEPVHIRVRLNVSKRGVHADFSGTSAASSRGINVPIVYTKAYCAYALKCALAPEIPNNHASLEPFTIDAPKGCIVNAQHPAPVSTRHVIGHLVPDAVFGALAKFMPDKIPAEGAAALWNIHISVHPVKGSQSGQSAEILMFNSGGSGARPNFDGLNTTAFPSGVMTMPVEATEHTGPLIVWRKELREGSGGEGKFRGGLGQIIEIQPAEGHEFHFNAMFDRVDYAPQGRERGGNGAKGKIYLADGTILKAKGRQFVPEGNRLVLELPGGGGFGDAAKRDPDLVNFDQRQGYLED